MSQFITLYCKPLAQLDCETLTNDLKPWNTSYMVFFSLDIKHLIINIFLKKFLQLKKNVS